MSALSPDCGRTTFVCEGVLGGDFLNQEELGLRLTRDILPPFLSSLSLPPLVPSLPLSFP